MTIDTISPETFPLHRVRLSRYTLMYRQHGNGPPLILLHGWGAASEYWIKTLQALADHFTCYAIELPGYGEAPPLLKTASAEQLADIVIAFADAMGLEQFNLNGHSFGGAIATYVAARWPQRVHRLVLTCFASYVTNGEQSLMSQTYYPTDLALTIWQPWMIMMRPWWHMWQCWLSEVGEVNRVYYDMARPFFHNWPPPDDMLREGFATFMCMDYRSCLESAISLANPELREALQSIAVPTLMIATRQDRMVLPSRVVGTAKIVPHARLAWIEQCGHIPMIEQPAEYHRVLQAFLQG